MGFPPASTAAQDGPKLKQSSYIPSLPYHSSAAILPHHEEDYSHASSCAVGSLSIFSFSGREAFRR